MNMKLILVAVAGLVALGAIAWFALAPGWSTQTAQPAESSAPATTESAAAATSTPEPTAPATGSEASSETATPAAATAAELDSASAGPPGGAKRDIGWMHGNCLVAKDDLVIGTELTVVTLDDPQTVIRGEVVKPVSSDDDCRVLDGLRRENNADKGSFYVVKTAAIIDYAAAVIHPAGVGAAPNPRMLDVNEDEILDTFTRCTAKEGERFSVWAAEPYNSKELWRADYALEGDKLPTCPPGR